MVSDVKLLNMKKSWDGLFRKSESFGEPAIESHIPNRKNPRRISTERLDRLNAER